MMKSVQANLAAQIQQLRAPSIMADLFTDSLTLQGGPLRSTQTWLSSVTAGDAYFQQGDYLAAETAYRQALYLQRQLLQTANPTCTAETLQLAVRSCDRISRNYQKLQQFQKAEEALRQAYDVSLAIMNRKTLPVPLRSEGYQGFFTAFKWLIQFYQEQGDSEKCNAIINHAKPLALRFFQEVQLLPEMASI
jgi:tetratricopeptide (TPR) repeat protein